MQLRRQSSEGMRVAINMLTDDPANPSGAHWGWTCVIPEIASRLRDGEELRLLVSGRMRRMHSGYPEGVGYLTFPWSNEHPRLRTLSEQLYTPVRLRLDGVDVFNTLIAPLVRPAPAVVAHFKTMHAFTAPESVRSLVRWYRRRGYPHTAEMADAVIINSESLRREVERYLDVDPAKLRLIPEAVDHGLFRPGDPDEARAHLAQRYGVVGPFVLFVSSLWPYKNCDGLLRAFARARSELGDHRVVVVGPGPRRRVRRPAEEAGRRARHRRPRDVGRWRPPRGDRPLLPRCVSVRVPIAQRDVRPAHPRGHGIVVPRGDLGPAARCPRPPVPPPS